VSFGEMSRRDRIRNSGRETSALPAISHEDFVGEASEAAAGDAHAQKAAEKSTVEVGVKSQRTDDGADFLFGFRGCHAPNTIEVASEIARSQKTDEKRHEFNLGMHGIPKNVFLELFLLVLEPGAKRGFKILW
jgi:hypothetical protein